MARRGRPERNRAARSFGELRRFHRGINSDKVFGTHRGEIGAEHEKCAAHEQCRCDFHVENSLSAMAGPNVWLCCARHFRHEMTDLHLSEVTVTFFSAAMPIVTLSSAPVLAA